MNEKRVHRLTEKTEELAAFGGAQFVESILRASLVQVGGAPKYLVLKLPAHLRAFLEERAASLADYQRVIRDGDVADDWSVERLLTGLIQRYYEECTEGSRHEPHL